MTEQRISMLLADDHAMFRGTLKRRLEDEPDMLVAGDFGTADETLEEAARTRPDIVLLDIDMPGMYCFEAARRIQEVSPDTRVVLLSAFHNDRYIEQAIEVKAWGYVVKNESEDALVEAIRRVASGAAYFSPDVLARIVVSSGALRLAASSATRVSTLTQRETEVLRHVARGLSNKEIAKTMHISPHTVHRHTDSIMAKLDIHNRVELTRFAIREGLAEA